MLPQKLIILQQPQGHPTTQAPSTGSDQPQIINIREGAESNTSAHQSSCPPLQAALEEEEVEIHIFHIQPQPLGEEEVESSIPNSGMAPMLPSGETEPMLEPNTKHCEEEETVGDLSEKGEEEPLLEQDSKDSANTQKNIMMQVSNPCVEEKEVKPEPPEIDEQEISKPPVENEMKVLLKPPERDRRKRKVSKPSMCPLRSSRVFQPSPPSTQRGGAPKTQPKGKSTSGTLSPLPKPRGRGRAAKVSGTLTSHKERRGSQAKHLVCPRCGEQLSRPDYLRLHLMKHTGETPHKCSLCDKSYRTRWRLTQHLRIHTNNLPYHCPYCTYRGNRSDNLASHLRRTHLQQLQGDYGVGNGLFSDSDKALGKKCKDPKKGKRKKRSDNDHKGKVNKDKALVQKKKSKVAARKSQRKSVNHR